MVNTVLKQPAIKLDAAYKILADKTADYSIIIKYGDKKLIDCMQNVVKRALSK